MLKRSLLVAIAFLILTGCKEELYTTLSEKDANEMLAVLLNNGIDSNKIAGKNADFSIHVDRSQMVYAIQLLNERGLPREKFQSFPDMFPSDGILPSPVGEHARLIEANSQVLQEMLAQIDGVITVRVRVNLPQQRKFSKTLRPASASVIIKFHPESNIEAMVPGIKQLVTNGIDGLSYDDVTVVLSQAQVVSPEGARPIPWKRTFGLKITEDSAGHLHLVLSAFGSLLLLALGACGYFFHRNRHLSEQIRSSAEAQADISATGATPLQPVNFRVVSG